MEDIAVVGCAALSGMAAILATSGARTPPPGALEVRRRREWERVRGALGALSAWPPVRLVASRGAWAELARCLEGEARGRGLTLSPEESGAALVTLWALSGVLAGIASWSPVGLLAMEGLFAIGVHVIASSLERRRARELSDSMPGIFRTLAIALGSGQTLMQAIDYVGAHERGPAAQVFARTSLRLRCGISAEEALSRLAEELDAPGMGLLVTALLISQRTGSPLRDLFLRSARLVERQGELERTLSVKTAQVRLSVRIVCLLPALMIGLLSLISPDFQAGLASPAGALSVTLALLMDGAALMIIRHLLKGVL